MGRERRRGLVFALLLVPPLQVGGAIVLLLRRGWLLLTLSTVPGVVLSGYLSLSGQVTRISPLLLCVVLPLPVLALTLLPVARTWGARRTA